MWILSLVLLGFLSLAILYVFRGRWNARVSASFIAPWITGLSWLLLSFAIGGVFFAIFSYHLDQVMSDYPTVALLLMALAAWLIRPIGPFIAQLVSRPASTPAATASTVTPVTAVTPTTTTTATTVLPPLNNPGNAPPRIPSA